MIDIRYGIELSPVGSVVRVSLTDGQSVSLRLRREELGAEARQRHLHTRKHMAMTIWLLPLLCETVDTTDVISHSKGFEFLLLSVMQRPGLAHRSRVVTEAVPPHQDHVPAGAAGTAPQSIDGHGWMAR